MTSLNKQIHPYIDNTYPQHPSSTRAIDEDNKLYDLIDKLINNFIQHKKPRHRDLSSRNEEIPHVE